MPPTRSTPRACAPAPTPIRACSGLRDSPIRDKDDPALSRALFPSCRCHAAAPILPVACRRPLPHLSARNRSPLRLRRRWLVRRLRRMRRPAAAWTAAAPTGPAAVRPHLSVPLPATRAKEVWETPDVIPGLTPAMMDFARIWQAADKIVYSKSLETVSTPKTRLADQTQAVRDLKAQLPHDISVDGTNLAAQAIRAGLVDEYELLVVPVMLGGGKRVLPSNVGVKLGSPGRAPCW